MSLSDEELAALETTKRMGISRPSKDRGDIIDELAASKGEVRSLILVYAVEGCLRMRTDISHEDPRMVALEGFLGHLFDTGITEEEMVERFEGTARGLMDVVVAQRAGKPKPQ